jgi:predicted nucleic acid-binding Zn ribbon protein
MPIYEYVNEQDGERIELLRPMSQADSPVDDPTGKGRVFKRVQSTFAAQGAAASGGGGGAGGGGGGCCPCGKGAGQCGSR